MEVVEDCQSHRQNQSKTEKIHNSREFNKGAMIFKTVYTTVCEIR